MPGIGRIRLRKKKDKYANYPDIPLNSTSSSFRRKLPSNLITTTKYTLWNFLPKNLFEQFRRMTNCYFLIIVIITFIPSISPLTPWTSVLPLSFVLGVTALKEAYEDFSRWREDNTVNNKKYEVLKTDGRVVKVKSKSLKVGDIVKVKTDQFLPADILPLSSALPDGILYIETAQLDGETYLKAFKAPVATNSLSDSEILALQGSVEAEGPSHDLYKWTGALNLEGGGSPLNEDNLVLRGARLRNTPWAVGIVVYTGKLTKLSLNQQLPPSKFSTVESRLNKCVIAIFTFKMFCVVIIAINSYFFNVDESPYAFYLDFDGSPIFQAVRDFFSYFALLSFMIPMSLMVTLEVVKVIQGKFMEWDRNMAADPNNVEETGMRTKTTNLNDELALVRYIFSDKTGTLTENCMEFMKVSINGNVYEHAGEGELLEALEGGDNAETIDEFLTCLAVCQGAVVDEVDGELEYKSQSPDEEALCDGAKKNGYAFNKRTQTDVTVAIRGEDCQFDLLNEIKFSSARARMSVVVRHPDGCIRVYAKGADSKMLPLLSNEVEGELKQKTMDDIESFSKEGLRTLILGSKKISDEEYEAWAATMLKAETNMDKNTREAEINAAAEAIEQDFELLGCTAIEDKLQKDVPETIHNLLRANIKFWMITGDKQETAENIARSCRLLKNNMELVPIISSTTEGTEAALSNGVKNYVDKKREKPIAVVVNGETLTFALEEHKENFLKLTSVCHSVVCCRVSPLQKALIVRLMKAHTKEVCLSIGDGANDVGMIQEAHIGVGIFGKEGTQAARSSDYAIQEFRHLRRLLTVHGRYSYIRNSGLIQYSIYKNAAAFLVQFWFAFYCGYSATTIYDDWIVTFFNIFFTSIPPLFYAIFEKDISDELIEEYPETYKYVQRGDLFTYSSLFTWMLSAVWHSLVFFLGGALLLSNEPFVYSGHTYGLKLMGNMVSTMAIITVVLKIASFTNLWNIMVHGGIWGSIVLYFIIFFFESIFPWIFPQQYFMFFYMVSNPNFWAMFLLVVIVCLLPDVFGQYIKRQFYPDDWQILQEAEHFKNIANVKRDLRAVEEARTKREREHAPPEEEEKKSSGPPEPEEDEDANEI